MQEVQLSRQRNGAYGWSIARDIGDPELWTERYHCPTWLDYLRQRSRPTQSERALHRARHRFSSRRTGTCPTMLERRLGRYAGRKTPRPRRKRGPADGWQRPRVAAPEPEDAPRLAVHGLWR